MEREGGHVLEQLVCECACADQGSWFVGSNRTWQRYRSSYLVL